MLLLVACEPAAEPSIPVECNPNAFRACETDACRGVEQCSEAGAWTSCACTVTDASFPEAATPDVVNDISIDAPSDAGLDASSDASSDVSSDADAADGS